MELAESGRKELQLVEHGMLGLTTCREEFGPVQSFRGLNIHISLHMTIQMDVLDEALQVLGARLQYARSRSEGRPREGSRRFTEQRHTVPGAVRYRAFKSLSINGPLHMTLQSGGFSTVGVL